MCTHRPARVWRRMPDQPNAAIDGPTEGSASAATSPSPAMTAALDNLPAPAGAQTEIGPDAGADASSAGGPSEASGSQSQPAASAPARPAPARPTSRSETRSLTYAVDLVFCIDVTGSMTPIIDAVKANALRFYDDVQANLTDKGKTRRRLTCSYYRVPRLHRSSRYRYPRVLVLHASRGARDLQRVRRRAARGGRRGRTRIGARGRGPGHQFTMDYRAATAGAK